MRLLLRSLVVAGVRRVCRGIKIEDYQYQEEYVLERLRRVHALQHGIVQDGYQFQEPRNIRLIEYTNNISGVFMDLSAQQQHYSRLVTCEIRNILPVIGVHLDIYQNSGSYATGRFIHSFSSVLEFLVVSSCDFLFNQKMLCWLLDHGSHVVTQLVQLTVANWESLGMNCMKFLHNFIDDSGTAQYILRSGIVGRLHAALCTPERNAETDRIFMKIIVQLVRYIQDGYEYLGVIIDVIRLSYFKRYLVDYSQNNKVTSELLVIAIKVLICEHSCLQILEERLMQDTGYSLIEVLKRLSCGPLRQQLQWIDELL